jgi:drug/metabolite transporter (DMT)-like permease
VVESPSLGIGEIAAVTTAIAWSLCAQFFGAAGIRIGSVAVNHLRLLAGFAILLVLHFAIMGTFTPHGTSSRDLTLLAISGIFGLILGDAAYFRALVLVGPATATIMVTTTPAFATLGAWIFLDETLPARALAGIAITVAGILVAVRGRAMRDPVEHAGRRFVSSAVAAGLFFALLGALGQATGQVLARPALRNVEPLSATIIRVGTAAVLLWGVLALRSMWTRRAPSWWAPALADRRALALTMGGVITGPSVGVWLSLVATRHAPVGIASTLMSLVPVFVLLEDWILGRRRPTGLEILGAGIAVVGVAVLVT